jgi:hypothetical protein
MDNAAAIVKSAGQQMGDAVVQSSDKMSSSSKRAGENLQQAYRAAARDAREAALQFGETSDRFRVAAQTAGELKDRLDLTNSTIKAFASDAPVLNATVGVMSSMAGAFSAAQGAAALFGNEGKALQETMVKLQGAMALSQGLKSLTEIGDSFEVMQATISTKVIPSLMTMKGALVATGIGIAVIAIGFLINAFNEQAAATELANKKLKDHQEQLKKDKEIVDDYILSAKQKEINAENEKYKELQKALAHKTNLVATEYDRLGHIVIVSNEKVSAINKEGNTQLEEAKKAHLNRLAEIEKNYSKDKLKEAKTRLDEEKKHLEEIQKMNREMGLRGGTDQGIYLIQRKKATGVSFGSQSNDELRQGIIKNLEAAKLNVPQTVTFTFKAEGLDEIQKAGQRMVVLNDGMKKMGETLKGMIVPALQNFGNTLGKALGGENVDGGAALKAMLADVCNSMAMTMYAMAAGYFAIQDYGHAAAATAAGIGLNIAAGVLGAGASGGGVSSGGGGGSAATNIGTFGNGGMNSNFGVLQVGGEIRGNNLLVSVNRSGYERGRVR